MSRLKPVFKLLRTIILMLLRIIKTALLVIPHFFGKLYRVINKRFRFSITFKMTTVYTLILTIMLFFIGVLIASTFTLFLYYESYNSLERNSRYVSELIGGNSTIPRENIKAYADFEDISVTIFDKSSKVVFSTAKTNDYTSEEFKLSDMPYSSIDRYQNMHFSINIDINGVNYQLRLSRSITKEWDYFEILLVILIAGFIIAVVATALIGSVTSRKLLGPINKMTHTAKTISAGALHTRLDIVDTHDELKEMAETFNDMLDRIQSSYEQQNLFVSDASHELRTPISVIQGYANLLQRWGKEDKDILEEAINAIKCESESMKELVERLLFLARADKNTQKLEYSNFNLNELIDDVIKESRIIDSEHEIRSDRNATIALEADRGLIKQTLRILLDNSMKYTPAGGTIKLNSILEGTHVILIVEDNGMGITKEDLPHIFDRFYKCDKSRTRESGGAGLGLSIAKWIVERHEGVIKIESQVGRGTKVIVNLPVSTEKESS